jgi:hypothetical protein
MPKRGKILRDPHAGPGLLIVEGQQHQFFLEGVWKSDVPPKPGLAVEVEFDGQGTLNAITAVPESQLAKEQAEIALAAAKKRGAALASSMVNKFGMPQLVAAGVLIFSWSFLTTVSAHLPFIGELEFTFWQVLGYLNSGNLPQALERHGSPATGIYGFLAVAVIAGPFLHHFWKDKRAALGGLVPLIFMLVVGILVRSSIHKAFGGPANGPYANVQEQAQEELVKAISLGLGAYLSLLASSYFAVIGARQFLAAKGSEAEVFETTQSAAA